MTAILVTNDTPVLSSTGDILRKKMRPRPLVVGACVTWWQAEADRIMRNVCKATFDLDVKLTGMKGRQALAPAALDEMPEIALPFLLSGGSKGAALFVLDGILIDGLIEQQLLGRILPTKRLDRPVTSIDAGLSEGFVRAALAGIAQEAPGQLNALSCEMAEQDRAALRLALGEGRYDILDADIELGAGVKSGRFEIWVPALPVATPQSGTGQPNPDMMAMLQNCEIELQARLEGCVATAQQLLDLEVGGLLNFPKSALSKVDILDGNGELFAQGRLGQLNGARAVRLTSLAHSKEPEAIPAPEQSPPATLPAFSNETLAKPTKAEPEPQEPAPKKADTEALAS